MTDKDLVEKIQTGDHDSFKVMIENHQRLIFNTCKGFLHNEEDAQDVAQDVFIEAYRSIKKFRGDSKISTWLYRIAVNKSLNFIRLYLILSSQITSIQFLLPRPRMVTIFRFSPCDTQT